MRIVWIICSFVLIPMLCTSGESGHWPGTFFQGYVKTIRGGNFSYHSPQPDVTTSILVRSLDSANYIAWETEKIPPDFHDPVAHFIWMFGVDANPDSHSFRLYLNDRFLLAFSNPVLSEKKSWSVSGNGGTMLDLLPTLLDKYNDPMGYAILTVPSVFLMKGENQTIRIVGESADSRSWYMTFESGVEEKVEIVPQEAVIRDGNGHFQPVLVEVTHVGEAVSGVITLDPGIRKRVIVEPGFNQFRFLLPEVSKSQEITASVKIGKHPSVDYSFLLSPVRHWTIYLVQHTHTDIGYTRPQTEILPEHLRYIDYALDFCDQTDDFPDEAKFRWTCETTWPIREYIKTRPVGQIERLRKRVLEGRIEITGLFLNSSDLADEASIAQSLQPIRLIREHGMPVRAAMQNDINGVSWCLIDYLSGAGIEYLNMAENDHRARKPFDKPTTFWWESPSGKRILVNRPEHYMWANQLGILTNQETFSKNLLNHLNHITEKGYPFSGYAIQFSGYLTDNSPPSTSACDVVRSWNDSYVWPKLQLATISEFMDLVKERYASELPVYRGAWPDWWIDGFGSAPIETAYARMTHADHIANQSLQALSVLMGVSANDHIMQLQDQVNDAIAFYDEHTFGAAESISDPLSENSIVQKGEKLSYVWEAVKKNRILREDVMGRVQQFFPKSEVPVITVFNPSNWIRSGVIHVYIDHEILPGDQSFTIVAEDFKPVPVQLLSSREEGSYWAISVKDIPPLGYRTLRIFSENEPIRTNPEKRFPGILENEFYRLEFDSQTFRIKHWIDKQTGTDLTDPDAPYAFGELIHEQLGTNREQLEKYRLEEYMRTTWKDLKVDDYYDGPVWTSVKLSGVIPECATDRISCEWRLYRDEKKVEVCYAMKKRPVTDPEAVYASFPFRLPESKFMVEIAGVTMIPGKDQLEGSSSDWIGIQNFISVKNDSVQIVFVSPEIPLVQLGTINLGKFARIANPETSHIYSWVLNNYWTTNFLASEEGEIRWTYLFTSSDDTSNLFASRFGWGNRIPLLTRIFPAQKTDSVIIPASFLGSALRNVIMVCARPSADGQGVILHLREVDGKSVRMPFRDYLVSIVDVKSATRANMAIEVNVLEEQTGTVFSGKPEIGSGDWLEMKPYETKFIKLLFTDEN